jgi:hypothetical protein
MGTFLLLSENRSHQVLQSGIADKVSDDPERFAFFCAPAAS